MVLQIPVHHRMGAVAETRLSVVDEADPVVVMIVGDQFSVAPEIAEKYLSVASLIPSPTALDAVALVAAGVAIVDPFLLASGASDLTVLTSPPASSAVASD